MSKHNRRDPRLPELMEAERLKRQPLEEIMERARKKLGVKTVWEKYGERAISGTEQAQPEESDED